MDTKAGYGRDQSASAFGSEVLDVQPPRIGPLRERKELVQRDELPLPGMDHLNGFNKMMSTESIKDALFLKVGMPDITDREEQAVLDVMRSGWLGTGPVTKRFEEEFKEVLAYSYPVKNAVAVNSCTMGLILALRCEGIGVHDEVITTPLTFAATVNAILAVGATPVFADVDESGCIDPVKIERAISPLTKAIIPVHLHGSPANMGEIMTIALQRGIKVIEDAAHAFGGEINNVPLGTIGHYGVFSFYPTKNITTGDGGMVICDDPRKADYIRTMASQGLSSGAWSRYGSGPIKNYEVQTEGYKGLMTDLNAAIGLVQLERWPEMREKRARIFDVYEEAFGKKIKGHSHHIYAIRVPWRHEFRKNLHNERIGTGIHYKALHTEPAFEVYAKGYKFPNAEQFGEETVSLPLSSTMSIEDAVRVVDIVQKYKGEK